MKNMIICDYKCNLKNSIVSNFLARGNRIIAIEKGIIPKYPKYDNVNYVLCNDGTIILDSNKTILKEFNINITKLNKILRKFKNNKIVIYDAYGNKIDINNKVNLIKIYDLNLNKKFKKNYIKFFKKNNLEYDIQKNSIIIRESAMKKSINYILKIEKLNYKNIHCIISNKSSLFKYSDLKINYYSLFDSNKFLRKKYKRSVLNIENLINYLDYNNHPKYSIIVPVYNKEKQISRCLKGLKKLEYKNYEVIIINDGSTDNSVSKIKPFLYDARFKLYNFKNNGLSIARNEGVKLSNGEYILFLDADDLLESKLLNIINKTLKENGNCDIIKYRAKFLKLNGEVQYEEFKTPVFYNKIGEDSINIFLKSKKLFSFAWGCVINRKFYCDNNILFPPGLLYEDYSTISIMYLRAKKVTSIDFVGYNYIETSNSICTNRSNQLKKAMHFVKQYYSLKQESKAINNESTKKIYEEYILDRILARRKNLTISEQEILYNKMKKYL